MTLIFLTIETEQEIDSQRWIADIPDLPGVMTYGNTPDEAAATVTAIALRVLADKAERGEPIDSVTFRRA